MLFSIITPSSNQLDLLRLCVSSVRDQLAGDIVNTGNIENVSFTGIVSTSDFQSSVSPLSVEHIIQDAGTPGIEEFARDVGADFYRDGKLIYKSQAANPIILRYHIAVHCESDGGMYDAINRGILKSRGEIICQLNSDEQYLCGALLSVEEHANKFTWDVLFGHVVVTDASNNYVCSRRVLIPNFYHTAMCQLNTFTAATFIKRQAFNDDELLFDTKWKIVSDADWVLRAIANRKRMRLIDRFTTSFMENGKNLGLTCAARAESAAMHKLYKCWFIVKSILIIHHRLRRLFAGYYCEKVFSFSLFTITSPQCRIAQMINRPNPIWRARL